MTLGHNSIIKHKLKCCDPHLINNISLFTMRDWLGGQVPAFRKQHSSLFHRHFFFILVLCCTFSNKTNSVIYYMKIHLSISLIISKVELFVYESHSRPHENFFSSKIDGEVYYVTKRQIISF